LATAIALSLTAAYAATKMLIKEREGKGIIALICQIWAWTVVFALVIIGAAIAQPMQAPEYFGNVTAMTVSATGSTGATAGADRRIQ